MTSKQNSKPRLDTVKWIIATAFVTGGVVANYLYIQQPWPIRMAVGIVLCLIVAAIAFQTQQGKRFWSFARDAHGELRRVAWPTRQETVQTTFVVVMMVVFVSLALWGLDSVLLWVVGILTGQRG